MIDLSPIARQAGARADRRPEAEDLARPRPGALRRQRHPVRRAAHRHRPAHEMGAALAAEASCTARFGYTMVYVTHDQTEALTFADKVVVMYEGEIVQIGTPEELFERPAHTFVGYFIGSPGMNVAAGRDRRATGRGSARRRSSCRGATYGSFRPAPDGARHPAGIRPTLGNGRACR